MMFFSHFLKVFFLRPLRLCGELLRKISVNQRLPACATCRQVCVRLQFLGYRFLMLLNPLDFVNLIITMSPTITSVKAEKHRDT